LPKKVINSVYSELLQCYLFKALLEEFECKLSDLIHRTAMAEQS
jgi:hypothetical protein